MTGEIVPKRVTFSDRQFLRAADLLAEQQYHRESRWRHNRRLHSWGVVAGLTLRATKDGERWEVRVAEGMALDGYGRELVVPYELAGDRRLDEGTEYDVWLEYADTSAGDTRRVELPRVVVTRRVDRQNPDPARPDAVPAGHLDELGPDHPPPDPAASRWPVFLATGVFRDSDVIAPDPWEFNPAERRYAGLVAERVVGPPSAVGDRTVLTTGRERGSSYRFAVRSMANGSDDPPFLSVREVMRPADKTGDPPRVETRVEVRAEKVAVAGDLTLKGGAAVEFAANPIGREGDYAAPLAANELWRMYHHFQPPGGMVENGKTGLVELDTSFANELRITMPGGSGGVNRVSIGSLNGEGKFTPILTVKDDKAVEVNGVLEVTGDIRGKVTAAPNGQPAGGADGLSVDQMRATVERYLKTANDPNPYHTVLAAVVSAAPATAAVGVGQYLTGQTPTPTPFAEGLWAKAPAALGTATANVSSDTFKAFLSKLGTLAGSVSAPDAVTVFGGWAFEKNKGAELVKGFPTDPQQYSGFAGELVKVEHQSKLTALIQALLGTDPDDAAEEELVRVVLNTQNHRTKNYERAGRFLTADVNHVNAFVGAASPEVKQLLAEALLGSDAGRKAVVAAAVPALPLPNVPLTGAALTTFNEQSAKSSRLYPLVALVRQEARAQQVPSQRVEQTVATLAAKLNDDAFWPAPGGGGQ